MVGKSHFFEVKNQVNNSADLYFYGDIIDNTGWKWDDSDVMPDDVKNLLDEIKDVGNLNIYINSGGGSVFAGLAIYNMLKRHKAMKMVYVDGVAASIASVIALAGDKVVIPSNAFLMIHKPWSWTVGNSNDFRKMADDLEKIEMGIMNVYKENLKDGVDIETIQQLVNDETWLTGEEAAQYFNIEVSESSNAAACTSEYFDKYNKTPSKIVKAKGQPAKPADDINLKQKIQNELELLAL
jgi:ATP-dependent Clp protease, protease subunit